MRSERLVRKLIVSLLSLSLIGGTTSVARAYDNDIIIEAGESAPFTGVLVREDNYRYFVNRSEESTILQKRIDEMHNVSVQDDSLFFTGLFAGAASMGILVLFLSK